MWKIGHIYIVPESEMRVIEWWLTLLDRHRDRDIKLRRDRGNEENREDNLQYSRFYGPMAGSAFVHYHTSDIPGSGDKNIGYHVTDFDCLDFF